MKKKENPTPIFVLSIQTVRTRRRRKKGKEEEKRGQNESATRMCAPKAVLLEGGKNAQNSFKFSLQPLF
jgi:hypothetical protein